MTTIPGGLLVVVEGIDGAGKTTLAARLAVALGNFGVAVAAGKEPTQGPFGQKLRDTALTGRLTPEQELELLLADRRQHVDQVIQPTLRAGGIVILDRYFYSNAAYQGAEGLDPAAILDQNLEFAPAPDLMLLLDLPVEEGLRRISARGDFANKFEQPESLQVARELFRRYLPESGVLIDATLSADEVFTEAYIRVVKAIGDKVVNHGGPTPENVMRTVDILWPATAHA